MITEELTTNNHNANMQSLKQPQLSYSQALKQNTNLDMMILEEEIREDYESNWSLQIATKKEDKTQTPFDEKIWTKDKIINILTNLTDLTEFLLDKLNTVLTNYIIPKAILLKFDYRDSAFFKTFTNKKNIMPAHQIEFNDLLQNAIKSYKLKNNITLTDKDTQNQIQTKLRQKLTTDYLSNLNFRPLNPHQTF